MKLLMLIVAEDKKEVLEVFLSRAGAVGYTEIPRAIGMGATGPRLGSGAFPMTSAVVFTVIEPAALETLSEEIKESFSGRGERVRMVAWDVESVL